MKILVVVFLFLIGFATVATAKTTASAQVSKFEIAAPQLHSKKTIWVYRPKSYQSSNKRYPVIYMFDAQNLFDDNTSYVGEWKVDEYLDTLANNEVIIIGIEHGNEKRIDELTPYANEKYGGGQGDVFMDFIINTVKPHVDITFRTLPDAQNTTVFGASLGGLMAFYAVIKYPNTFSKAGVFSPSFWVSDKIFDFAESSQIPKTSKFYFLVGSKEGLPMVENQNKMVSLLLNKEVNQLHVHNAIIEGGEHNEAFWASQFPAAFNWLFQDNLKLSK